MPYDRLIQQKRIKLYPATREEVDQLLQVAARDLATAVRNLDEAPDWTYSIAYDAILQASRALMLANGYRPRGPDQHATVVEFIEERLGTAFTRCGYLIRCAVSVTGSYMKLSGWCREPKPNRQPASPANLLNRLLNSSADSPSLACNPFNG